MAKRRTLHLTQAERDAMIEGLRAGHRATILASQCYEINSPEYLAAQAATSAISKTAKLVTGNAWAFESRDASHLFTSVSEMGNDQKR